MKTLTAFVLAFSAGSAYAVICKTVDPRGGVSYADVPAADCANKVNLPEPSRYSPVPRQGTRPVVPGPPSATPAEVFAGYTAMSIEQPAQQATIRSNEGKVPVSVALSPTLQPSHKLRFMLDGVQIQPAFASQSVTLTHVERGRHTVSAHVIDDSGRILRSAVPVSFYLRKASLQDPNSVGDTESSAAESQPQFVAPTQGAAPFSAADTPNYSATPPAPANTPGRTNPAFAPKYQP